MKNKKVTAVDYTNERKKDFFESIDSSKIADNKTLNSSFVQIYISHLSCE